MTYLIDSDILISAAIGRPDAQILIDDATRDGVAISVVSLGEVYEGAVSSLHGENRAKLYYLRQFLHVFPVVGLDDPIMELFARIRAELRSQGQLIADLDILIAASALEHDLTVVSRNVRHFQRIPGLKVRSE